MKAHFVADAAGSINNFLERKCSSKGKQLSGEMVGNGSWNGNLVSNLPKKYLVLPLSCAQVVVLTVKEILEPLEKIIFVALNVLGALFLLQKASIADGICNLESCLFDVICLPMVLAMKPISLIIQIYLNANGSAGSQQAQMNMQHSLNGMATGKKPRSALDLKLQTAVTSTTSDTVKRPIWSRFCAIPYATFDVTLEVVRTLMQVILVVESSISNLWKSLAELSVVIAMFPIKLTYQVVTALVSPGTYASISEIKISFIARNAQITPSTTSSKATTATVSAIAQNHSSGSIAAMASVSVEADDSGSIDL